MQYSEASLLVRLVYWTDIFKSFKDKSGVEIPPDPLTALFGAPPELMFPRILM